MTAPLGETRKPLLSAEGVSKHFGHVTALQDVTIAVFPAEIVALVGDNGAGKSTFVAVVSGVLEPDTGTITINGEPVRLDSPLRAREVGIATVFQDLALVDERDVAANLWLGREPRRWRFFVDRPRMLREAAEMIRRLGVALPSVRALAGDLSGGQRQALAVARAVAEGGQIMLMDEPTAALGVREGRRVLELMAALRREGHGILFVAHNLEYVFELADRIAVLRHGRLVAERQTTQTSREEIVSFIVGARPEQRAEVSAG